MSADLHVVTFCHDIAKYPPILSLVNYLSESKKDVLVLGFCSNEDIKREWRQKGVAYIEALKDVNAQGALKKMLTYLSYKKKVKSALLNNGLNNINKVWVIGSSSIWILNECLYNFPTVFYHMETPSFFVPLRYRVLNPRIKYMDLMKSADSHIACEYNRASIIKYFFGLKDLPYVVPNKNIIINDKVEDVCDDSISYNIVDKLKNKKGILYQGIFNYPERRLDELCESINYLPHDYVIVLMGSGLGFERLKNRYESDRVFFQDYIPFPYHIEITKKCHIGFLSYFPNEGNITSVLNTIYCAPNKIYEYAGLGMPFISNDLPSLQNIAYENKCGICVKEYTPQNIAKAVLKISENYDIYSNNSYHFYSEQDNNKIFDILVSG